MHIFVLPAERANRVGVAWQAPLSADSLKVLSDRACVGVGRLAWLGLAELAWRRPDDRARARNWPELAAAYLLPANLMMAAFERVE